MKFVHLLNIKYLQLSQGIIGSPFLLNWIKMGEKINCVLAFTNEEYFFTLYINYVFETLLLLQLAYMTFHFFFKLKNNFDPVTQVINMPYFANVFCSFSKVKQIININFNVLYNWAQGYKLFLFAQCKTNIQIINNIFTV